jgi:hypothetical protein
MSAMMRRIEELERREEWHDAFASIERVVAWAVAVGKCTEAEGIMHLSEMVGMVPLELFVAGKWTPPPAETPEAETKTTTMMDAFHAWERSQGIAP